MTPVNPYVTGSSPVARAKISADFCGFSLLLPQQFVPAQRAKNRQKTPIFYTFYTQNYTFVIRENFYIFYQQALHQYQQGFQKIRSTPDTRNFRPYVTSQK